MVSLDNLKTAISAIKSEIKAETNSIKSEINRIATRYLKKTDASKIYITKDSANKSFATKSSVTEIRYFSESQDTLTKIDELRFPYFSRKANRFLGTVEYNPLQSNLGNLRVAGVDNIGFVFNLPENNEADTAYLSDAGIISLIPGLSQSGLFARSDLYLRDVKKVALSNTKDEYSTLTKNQGTMYYNVRVIDRQDDSRSLSFKLSASSNPNSPRLQGMTYGKDGALYYFVSDEIYSNSTVDIPFTLTRIDRYEKLPNPNNLKIFYHGRDRVNSEEEISYDGTQARALHIYSSAVNVNLSQQGNLYHSDLAYSVIGINRNSGAFVFAKFSYGGLNYSLPLVHIDADTRRCVFIGLVNKSDYDATFMMFIGDADSPSAKLQGTIETYTVPLLTDGSIVIDSSTTGSTKKFKITVDDNGALSLINIENSSEVWNGGTYSKPTGGIPKADLAEAVQTSLGKADTALQEHQSLAAYRTAAMQNLIDVGKQDKLIAGENITIASDGKTISATGGGAETLVVTITDNNGTLSVDKTYNDILNAIVAGIPVLVNYAGMVLPLVGIADALYFGVFQCDSGDATNPAVVATVMIEITQNGEVNDISVQIDIPTVPTKTSQLENDSGYLTLATLPKYGGEVI